MFNRKAQQVHTLQSRIDKLVEQRDEAIRERDAAVRLNGRLASKVGENSETDAREMARLQDVTEGWIAIAGSDARRSDRLTRAVPRYWAEIGRLRRENAAQRRDANERVGKLEAKLQALQDANEQHYRDLQQRPARRRVQRPAAAA